MDDDSADAPELKLSNEKKYNVAATELMHYLGEQWFKCRTRLYAGDVVILMDSDFQGKLENISELIDMLEQRVGFMAIKQEMRRK